MACRERVPRLQERQKHEGLRDGRTHLEEGTGTFLNCPVVSVKKNQLVSKEGLSDV